MPLLQFETKKKGQPLPVRYFFSLFDREQNNLAKYGTLPLLSFLKQKNPQQINVEDSRKATTYSPTDCSTIGANGLNFSVRNGKR